MRVVQIDELPLESRANLGRGGTGHQARVIFTSEILGRDPTLPDNFYFGISYSSEGQFSSPRHRHTFDQFRYMLDGFGDYPEGKMTGGVLGYFPQGAYYGPQETLYGTLFICQFGGPSGQGYIDRAQMRAAVQELRARNTGTFDGGTYYRSPGLEGEETQDAHEAISEFIRQGPTQYPAPQYATPLLIDSNVYPWVPLDDCPGVAEKALGTFTSCKYRSARFQLQPGARFAADGRGIYVVLSGSGSLDGEDYRKFTALYLEDGEQAMFAADETTDILLLGLPTLRMIEASAPPQLTQAAA